MLYFYIPIDLLIFFLLINAYAIFKLLIIREKTAEIEGKVIATNRAAFEHSLSKTM